MKLQCIYQIRNTKTGGVYIGSTNDGHRRWTEHLRKLKAGVHDNRYLQASFLKHGEEYFIFEVIELVGESEKLIEREQIIFDDTKKLGLKTYNIGNFVAAPLRGVTGEQHPFFGRKLSTEHKEKCTNRGERNGMFGRNHSPDSKAKMCAARIGSKASDETRSKMSIAREGRKKSEEHKQKIRIANIGKIKPRGAANHKYKGPVQQIDTTGMIVAEYSGTIEILNAGFSPSGVSSVITGKQKTHRGYKWKRKT